MPELDWTGELASTKVDYNGEGGKHRPSGYVEAIGASVTAAWKSRVCEGRRLAGRLGTGLHGGS